MGKQAAAAPVAVLGFPRSKLTRMRQIRKPPEAN